MDSEEVGSTRRRGRGGPIAAANPGTPTTRPVQVASAAARRRLPPSMTNGSVMHATFASASSSDPARWPVAAAVARSPHPTRPAAPGPSSAARS